MARMYDPGSTKRQQALTRKQEQKKPAPAPAPKPRAPQPIPPPPVEATRPPLGTVRAERTLEVQPSSRKAALERKVSGRAGGGSLPGQRALQAEANVRGGKTVGERLLYWSPEGPGGWAIASGVGRLFGLGPPPNRPTELTPTEESIGTKVGMGMGVVGGGSILSDFGGGGPALEYVSAKAGPVLSRLRSLIRREPARIAPTQAEGTIPSARSVLTPEEWAAKGAPQEIITPGARPGATTLYGPSGERVVPEAVRQQVEKEATEQVAKTGIREGTAAGEEAIEAGMRAGQRELGREAEKYLPKTTSTLENLLSKAGTTIAKTGPGAAIVSLAAKPFVQGIMQTAPYVGAGLVPTEPPPTQPEQTPPPQPTTTPTTVEEASKSAMARLAQAGIGEGGVTQPQQPPVPPEGQQLPPGGGPGELPNIPGEQPPTGREEPGATGGGVTDWNTIIGQVEASRDDLVSTLNDALTRNDTEAVGLTAAFAQSFLDDIARMRSDLVAMYEQMGQEIDPATQAMLDNLEKTLQDQLSAAEEEANRRGMYWSGILEEGKLRLRTGYMSDRAKMLGERLSGIRDQMWQALNNLYNSATGQLGNIYQTGLSSEYTARENAAQRRADLMDQLLNQRMELERIRQEERRQQQEQARLEKQQQEEYQRWLAEQIATQTGTIAPGLPGAGGPTWERQYQQGQLNLRAQQAGGGGRAAGTDASATQYILQSLRGMPVDQALAQLDAEAGELASMGVDVNYVRSRLLAEAAGVGTR